MGNLRGVRASSAAVAAALSVASVVVSPAAAIRISGLAPAPGYTTETTTVSISGTPARDAVVTGLSSDGTRVLVEALSADVSSRQLLSINLTADTTTVISSDQGCYAGPYAYSGALSADGTMLAYVDPNKDLFVRPTSLASPASPITSATDVSCTFGASNVALDADGSKVAYIEHVELSEGNTKARLEVANTSGSPSPVLVEEVNATSSFSMVGEIQNPVLSADGSRVAYAVFSGGRWYLRVKDLSPTPTAVGTDRVLTPNSVWGPNDPSPRRITMSADGAKLAWVQLESIEVPPAYEFGLPTYRKVGHLYVAATTNGSPSEANPLGSDLDGTTGVDQRSGYADVSLSGNGSVLVFTAYTTDGTRRGPQAFRLTLPTTNSPGLIAQPVLSNLQGTSAVAANNDGSVVAMGSAWQEQVGFETIPKTALAISRPAGGLSKPTAAWAVPKYGGLARLGDDVTVTATTPESGVALAASLSLKRWSGLSLVDATVTVPLVKGLDDIYSGTYTLVENDARIVDASVTATKGEETASKSAGQAAVDVGARFSATSVDLPDGESGYVAALSSPAGGGALRQALSDGTPFALSPIAAGDYDLGVFDSSGRPRRPASTLTLRAGKTHSMTLAASPLASLTVQVNGDGDDMSPTRVLLYDGSNYVTSGPTDPAGSATFEGLPVGRELRIRTFGLPRLQGAAEVTKTLVAGANAATVTATLPPRFTLTGTVLRSSGRPAVGATVSIGQATPIGRQSITAVTDLLGRYSVELLDGRPGGNADFKDLDWTVTYAGLSEAKEINLQTASTPSVINHTLGQAAPFKVLVRILNEGGTSAQNLNNPLVAVHLDVMGFVDGQWLTEFFRYGAAPPGKTGGMAFVPGRVGSNYRVCANGMDAGFGTACGEITLAEVDDYQTLELTLPEQRAFTMTVTNNAVPFTGNMTWQLFELSGANNTIRTLKNSGYASPDRSGKILVSDPSITVGKRYSIFLSSQDGNATVTSGVVGTTKRVSLGTVRLSQSSWFDPTTTSITSDQSVASLGGRVRIRVQLTPTESMTAVMLTVPLTTGLSYINKSLTVNNAPADEAKFSVSPTLVTLSLGNLAAQTSIVIAYDLFVANDFEGEFVPASVEMRFTPPGQPPKVERINGGDVGVSPLMIAGPPLTSTRSVTITGDAPPGQTVTVTERNAVIGQATASSEGHWSLAVTLPDRGRLATYRLKATAGTYKPAAVTIVYDEYSPMVTNICMSGVAVGTPADAATIDFCFDPRLGVASFPFMYAPNQLTRVRFTVDHPELVDYLDVTVGATSATATKQTDPGHFNTFMADVGSSGSGDLYARLVGRRSTVQVPLAYLEQVTSGITPNVTVDEPEIEAFNMLSAIELDNPTALVQTDTANEFSVEINADPASPGLPESALTTDANKRTVTFAKQTYTPNATDVANVGKSGLGVYGVQTEVVTLPDGKSQRTTVAYVDPSLLPGVTVTLPSSPLGARGLQPRVGVVDVAMGVVKFMIREVGAMGYFERAFLAGTSFDSAKSAFGEGDKWDKLNKSMDLIGGCLTPAQVKSYSDKVTSLGNTAMAFDVFNTAINVVGLVAAPATFGLGSIAIWAGGWLIGKATDYYLDKEMELLETQIVQARLGCARGKPILNPNWQVGRPLWIYDPSGYAYEGSPEFRVPGVTTTLLKGSSLTATDWAFFDMTPYGQTNPLVTNDVGRYAWFVPEGFWKVQFTKDGFLPAFSDAVEVLPPQFEVHGSMVRETAPVVASRSNDGRGIIVTFDQPMRVASVTAAAEVRLSDGGGALVNGTWEPVVSGTDVDDGALLAKAMRFVPEGGIQASTTYWVRIGTEAADHTGRPMAAAFSGTVTTPAAALIPVGMNRLVDTRKGKPQLTATAKSKLGANKVLTLSVSGVGGVPASGVGAVSLLVSVAGPGKAGALTVYPCDQARPTAPSINFSKGQTLPGAVIARLSAVGTVCIHSSASTDVLVDIDGYFPAGGGVTALNPVRLMDTRTAKSTPRTVDDQFWKTGTRSAGSETRLTVSGRGGIPANARAVALRLTVSGSKKAGALTAYPCGTPRPSAPNLAFAKGQTVSALAFVPPGNTTENEGEICVHTSQAAHVAIDALGFAEPTALVDVIKPSKLLDTLPTSTTTVDGADWKVGRRAANSVYQLTVAGRGGVGPGATAALITLTVTGSSAAGALTAFPCGTTRPTAAQLVYGKNQTVTASVVVPLGTGPSAGKVCLFTTKPAHLRVEAVGAAAAA